MASQSNSSPDVATAAASSPVLLVLAWAIVVLPTAWGLQHTVQSALKLFHAPTSTTQPAPAAKP